MKLELFVHALRVIDVGVCHVPRMRDGRKCVYFTVHRVTTRDAYSVTFGYPICPRLFMGIRIRLTLICPNRGKNYPPGRGGHAGGTRGGPRSLDVPCRRHVFMRLDFTAAKKYVKLGENSSKLKKRGQYFLSFPMIFSS